MFPALGGVPCGGDVLFYFSADATDGKTYSHPLGAPGDHFSARSYAGETIFAQHDFESSEGWSVSNTDLADGAWVRGVPAGGGGRGDPPADADGSGACWVTDNVAGDSDVDGGPTRLLSRAYDLSGQPGVICSYARWMYNDDGDDFLVVEVSANDGVSWTTVESFQGLGGWQEFSFAVEDYVSLTSQFRIRFSVADNPNDSVTECGVDAFKLSTLECPLLLDAHPHDPVLGGNLDFTTRNGKPATPGVLFLLAIDSVPFPFQIASGLFGVDTTWLFGAVVPSDPNLSGLDLDFATFGFGMDGVLTITNVESVGIQ